MTPKLIACDWGSTNLRVFLLDDDGKILGKKFARRGILNVRKNRFQDALQFTVGDWLKKYPDLPIIMSGMIGSRQGWVEVPYQHCPCNLNQLANNLTVIEALGRSLLIVPGVDVNSAKRYDVMRGEETQIAGAIGQQEKSRQMLCLPGTHSKWAIIEDHVITKFTTYMTGELFTLLARYSILSRLLTQKIHVENIFIEGLNEAEQTDEWLSQIFQGRTKVLAKQLAETEVHSYLSGLLIGYEIKQGLQHYPEVLQMPVGIVANERVAQLYQIAFAQKNIRAEIHDVDRVSTEGLFQLARLAKLI